MPFACAVIVTLAALGVVFLFVIAANAWDGFVAWRRWRAFVRLTAALPPLVESLAKHTSRTRDDAPGDDVAGAHDVPVAPCERQDCPRRTRGR